MAQALAVNDELLKYHVKNEDCRLNAGSRNGASDYTAKPGLVRAQHRQRLEKIKSDLADVFDDSRFNLNNSSDAQSNLAQIIRLPQNSGGHRLFRITSYDVQQLGYEARKLLELEISAASSDFRELLNQQSGGISNQLNAVKGYLDALEKDLMRYSQVFCRRFA